MSIIGLLGGTGSEGQGLALRCLRAGESIFIGSRSSSRAHSAADAIRERLAPAGAEVLAGTNAEAARNAEIAIVCLPLKGLEETLTSVASELRGKVVIEVVNPVQRGSEGFEHAPLQTDSAAEMVAALLPESEVVSAFKTLSAKHLAEIEQSLHGDTFICGDRPRAKQVVTDLVARMPDLRAIDCGPLRNARYVEAATVLLLEINRRHSVTTSLQLLGFRPPR